MTHSRPAETQKKILRALGVSSTPTHGGKANVVKKSGRRRKANTLILNEQARYCCQTCEVRYIMT